MAGALVAGGASIAASSEAAPAAAAPASAAPAPMASAPITVDRVHSVVAELRTEPGFENRHTERRLRWINDHASRPVRGKSPVWLLELARWLAAGGRGLMWLLGAFAVALLAVFAWRWARVKPDDVRTRAALR